jgi:hypothetical protein
MVTAVLMCSGCLKEKIFVLWEGVVLFHKDADGNRALRMALQS